MLGLTIKEGRSVHGDNWKKMDQTDLQGHLGLLILAGVYRSSKEVKPVAYSVWEGIFHAT